MSNFGQLTSGEFVDKPKDISKIKCLENWKKFHIAGVKKWEWRCLGERYGKVLHHTGELGWGI